MYFIFSQRIRVYCKKTGFAQLDEDEDTLTGQFYLDIEVRMADSIENEANYATNLSVALSFGNGLALVASRDILVFRDNAETSKLELSVNVTNDTTVYTAGLVNSNIILTHFQAIRLTPLYIDLYVLYWQLHFRW